MKHKKGNEIIPFLRSLPLFDVLNDVDLECLAAEATVHQFPKQTYIYHQGQRSDMLFLLMKGSIKIGTYADEDKEIIKQILHPLAIFGELGLTGEEKRSDFALTMNEGASVCSLSVAYLQQLMNQNRTLALRFLQFIGEKLRKTEHKLEAFVFKDARQRIIDFLRESAQQRGKKIGYEMLIKHSLTQQDIANITGTSRQTVTSVLNELRKSNLIYFNRRSILIRDLAKLA